MGAWMDGCLNPVKASSSLKKAATPLSSLLSNNLFLAGKEYILKDKLRERMRLKGGIECTFYCHLISSDVLACLEEKVKGLMSLSKESII